MIYLVSALLFISVCLNIYLYRNKPKPDLSLEAKDLLSDLLNGGALIKIDVIDPTDLLIRRRN